MTEDITAQSVLFPDLLRRPVVVKFDQPHASSDGGAILLKACDERLGLTERLSACISDARQAGKVEHSIRDLVRQRLFGIACGYADCNDAARLAEDPIQKLLIGRDPLIGAALASQSTLSRFENSPRRAELYRMGEELAESVIERQRKRLGSRNVKQITIDLDPTDDPTHGGQQLTFFNGHYDTWCYLPVAGFLTFNRESEQYLFCYVLRAGNAPAKQGAIGILDRVIERVRATFPKARILVRLDGGFAGPALLNYLEDEAKVDYIIGMAENKALKRRARRLMGRVRRRSKRSGKTANVFGETRYAAKSWKDRKRRVLIKAEVVRLEQRDPKDNERFVVTNLKGSPRYLYKKVYCARGEIENRIKELHHGLEIDRTSCTSFLANQLRVLLTAAAYVLMQELRLAARTGECARAQVGTLRERLLKLGVWVERSVRRIVLHMPQSFPYLADWLRIARSVGAAPA
ncbi:MAG TPA: IS1380 family transposase [Steroidobacteraceae bacterium]|nr:IS1380 family transposase [Steroidobacteraceae bacterium]